MIFRTAGVMVMVGLWLAACTGAKPSRPPECLVVRLGDGRNIDYLVDTTRILPARTFNVRLDSLKVSTWSLSGRRLGLLASQPNARLAPAGVWRPSAADSVVLLWWGGFDGVGLTLAWSGHEFRGTGLQEDDGGCPGADYCYSGVVTAEPTACPTGPWLQADSSGWVPWR